MAKNRFTVSSPSSPIIRPDGSTRTYTALNFDRSMSVVPVAVMHDSPDPDWLASCTGKGCDYVHSYPTRDRTWERIVDASHTVTDDDETYTVIDAYHDLCLRCAAPVRPGLIPAGMVRNIPGTASGTLDARYVTVYPDGSGARWEVSAVLTLDDYYRLTVVHRDDIVEVADDIIDQATADGRIISSISHS